MLLTKHLGVHPSKNSITPSAPPRGTCRYLPGGASAQQITAQSKGRCRGFALLQLFNMQQIYMCSGKDALILLGTPSTPLLDPVYQQAPRFLINTTDSKCFGDILPVRLEGKGDKRIKAGTFEQTNQKTPLLPLQLLPWAARLLILGTPIASL